MSLSSAPVSASTASTASTASPASTASTAPPPYLYCGTSRESSAVSFSASGYLTCAQPLAPLLSSLSSSSSSSSSWSAKASSASSADDGSVTPRIFKNLVVARGCTIDIYAGSYTTIASRTSLNIHVNISCVFDFSFYPYA
jgi:hypothetical protein